METIAHRVLVIEDNHDTAEALQVLLASWGFEVDVAHDRVGGLGRAALRRPDVIIVDLGLPTIEDGFAVVRELRGMAGGDQIFVVAVTGHGRDFDRRRALEAGCDLFFLKPPDLDALHRGLGDAHRELSLRAGT
jgi:DNA-binding response OmpR family regulator